MKSQKTLEEEIRITTRTGFLGKKSIIRFSGISHDLLKINQYPLIHGEDTIILFKGTEVPGYKYELTDHISYAETKSKQHLLNGDLPPQFTGKGITERTYKRIEKEEKSYFR